MPPRAAPIRRQQALPEGLPRIDLKTDILGEMSEGGCLCGAVRYRMVGAPLSSAICHCASCRRASGAPTVAWLTV